MKGFIDFWKDTFGIDPILTLLILFVLVFGVFFSILGGDEITALDIISIAVFLSPVWVPIAALAVLLDQWMEYVKVKQIINTEYVLLEIKLSEDIVRTPLAMETVLNVMFHTGEPGDIVEKYWDGKTRPQFSLEIVSLEGAVHFYIRTRRNRREIVEAQVYSQYPMVEITEVEDYAARIQYDEKTMDMFVMEEKLEKPDPYPIKTYVDFGLDKPGLKEEEKIDPMNSILEFMGSLGKGEYCYMQVIVRSHEPTRQGLFGPKVDWKAEAEGEVKEIIDKLRSGGEQYVVYRPPTEGEKEVMTALQRNISKKPFETGIRVLYFGYKEHYNKNRLAGIPTMFRSFQSHSLNNFKPVFRTMFNWQIQNPLGRVARWRKREGFDAYRWRSFLIPPYRRSWAFILSSEELATVYHFPGRSATTPSMERASSRKAEAPPNLPR
ncbi:MAG TPA: hypothetical protein VGA06_01120 [Candidatus Paceibacterota bacterium]|jgi:hypothetical protein